MHYSKLKISSDAASKLRSLRQRTGLTPNLLCRIALMASLEEGPPGTVRAPDEEGNEFNAYTLSGEYGAMFAAARVVPTLWASICAFIEPSHKVLKRHQEIFERFAAIRAWIVQSVQARAKHVVGRQACDEFSKVRHQATKLIRAGVAPNVDGVAIVNCDCLQRRPIGHDAITEAEALQGVNDLAEALWREEAFRPYSPVA